MIPDFCQGVTTDTAAVGYEQIQFVSRFKMGDEVIPGIRDLVTDRAAPRRLLSEIDVGVSRCGKAWIMEGNLAVVNSLTANLACAVDVLDLG